MIIYDFAFFLTLAVIITGLITLLDVLVLARRRAHGRKPSWLIEYSRAFFPVLLLVWGIRSFLIQPYRVPSSSLVPTVLPGDFIAVKQFAYGLRFPIGNIKFLPMGYPHRGQIALFHYPVDPNMTFIKRVIGLPGDHIVYHNKTLYINGKEAKQKFLRETQYADDSGLTHTVYDMQEDLRGVKHHIYLDADHDEMDDIANPYVDVVVPPGHYFMMGDNRDDSGDSRVWGFVPDRNLIGQAFIVFMSWDSRASSWAHKIRWRRIGTWLTPQKSELHADANSSSTKSSSSQQPTAGNNEQSSPAVTTS